jgi:hypothetical protein
MADLRHVNETEFDNAYAARNNQIDPGLALNEEAGNGAASASSDPNNGSPDGKGTLLFPSEQCKNLSDEWQNIQASFVDAPRVSVQKADALVKKTVGILETSFAEMHNSLEQNWERDRQVSTEDLRLALQNYRSLFQRLLSV